MRTLFRIFKRPTAKIEEQFVSKPTGDTIDKILSLASETTGRPADRDSIAASQKNQRQPLGIFNAAAFQRVKLAKRIAKSSVPDNSPAWFDPQLPIT
ncbi:MAG: hypothetical protein VYE44_03740 [Verrucomicrobiota bacterium]|nr:hypothetical protein [Verrucomicrobiota bacterium]